jgi:hypothetical protein
MSCSGVATHQRDGARQRKEDRKRQNYGKKEKKEQKKKWREGKGGTDERNKTSSKEWQKK